MSLAHWCGCEGDDVTAGVLTTAVVLFLVAGSVPVLGTRACVVLLIGATVVCGAVVCTAGVAWCAMLLIGVTVLCGAVL